MKDEIDVLEKENTWVLVEHPKDIKVVGFKWAYKMKKGVDGEVVKYKLRLVAKGYSQKV